MKKYRSKKKKHRNRKKMIAKKMNRKARRIVRVAIAQRIGRRK